MARPEQFPVKKVIGFDDALVHRVEDWRREQTPIPNFSEAVRALIEAGIDASLPADVEAALAAAQVKAKKSRAWIIEKALSDWLEARTLLPGGDQTE